MSLFRSGVIALRNRPRLYDTTKRLYRQISPSKPLSYQFLDGFSRAHGGDVNFVQIGANDGLRNDPIREFIIRDKWTGILIEPLPHVFETLKSNYQYLAKIDLIFINAAVTAMNNQHLSFWTFSNPFLQTLTPEERLTFLRKSSFEKSHVEKLLTEHQRTHELDKIVVELKVPCLTLRNLLERHWPDKQVDLLVIDAEGHEASIIPAIDFDFIKPDAIFFESSHLGSGKKHIFEHLTQNGYATVELVDGQDAVATRINGSRR